MGLEKDIGNILEKLNRADKGATKYSIDFHVHTPGSLKEYKIGEYNYEAIDTTALLSYAIKEGLFNDRLRGLVDKKAIDKSYLMAEIIIRKALKAKIDIIVITDHHTIEWYTIIKNVVNHIKGAISNKFSVLPGVEITVQDYHVVAILNPYSYEQQWEKICRLIEFSGTFGKSELGTTKSLIEVIRSIRDVGGIACLPHLDTYKDRKLSDIVKGSFMNVVLNDDCLDAIGLNDITRSSIIEEKTAKRKKPIAYIQGSDAHCPDKIGLRYSTLKMDCEPFIGVKECISNPDLRLNVDIARNQNYIIGIAIRNGFLGRQDGHWQIYPFNPDLNCLIGGKGTGKSTILKYITSVFRQRFSPEDKDFLSQAEYILIFLQLGDELYCIQCKCETVYDGFERRFWAAGQYIKGIEANLSKCTKIYRILKLNNGNIRITTPINQEQLKEYVLSAIYPETYAQAELQYIANNPETLSQFFHNIIRDHVADQNYREMVAIVEQNTSIIKGKIHKIFKDAKTTSDIRGLVDNVYALSRRQREYCMNVIERLNSLLDGKIKIDTYEEPIYDILEPFISYTDKPESFDDLIGYYLESIHGIDSLGLLILLAEEKYDEIIKNSSFDIYEFKANHRNVSDDLYIGFNDIKLLKRFREILEENFYFSFESDIFNKLIFSVMLNINSYRQVQGLPELYKPLNELSFGQRNVAMLTLIMEGFTLIGHNSPLIIDQPEDHLDNSFISEHLVDNLRRIKGRRQIIVATHNPNIPVSGDAEYIVCLESDGIVANVKNKGSIDRIRVIEFIIQYMEGGPKGLELRLNKYQRLGFFR